VGLWLSGALNYRHIITRGGPMTSTVPLSSESMESQRGPFEVVRDGDLAMTTRDGVILRADVHRPEAPGPRPVLVRRTPYGKRSNDLAADFSEVHYFASHGYLVVVQDTRGRFTSEGVWYPFIYEGRDGYDTIEWAATLPGSSGAVGTLGQSYGAIVQYLAATQRPPRLRTCIPVSAYQLTFENCWYNAGALELGWLLSYFVNMAEDVLAADGDRASIAELAKLKVDPTVRFSALTEDALRHLPLRDWIDRLGRGAPFLADILWHWTDGPYWWATDLSRQLFNINVPMLHIGSWYDIANRDTPLYFTGLRSSALDARDRHALIMGPWAHQLPFNQPTSGGTGDIDFGPEAAISLVDIERRWFDHYLKAEGADLPCSPVRIFVMGENRWRDEQQWPLARADYTSFYLHSGGSANTVNGDGILSVEAPGDEPADRYRHEPDNPVPTAGGRFVGGGVADQARSRGRRTRFPLAHDERCRPQAADRAQPRQPRPGGLGPIPAQLGGAGLRRRPEVLRRPRHPPGRRARSVRDPGGARHHRRCTAQLTSRRDHECRPLPLHRSAAGDL
jgi:uncharacterized protein